MANRTNEQTPDMLARLARQLVELALPFVFTPEWRAWMLEQRLAGTSRQAILDELCANGIPAPLARQALINHEREMPLHLFERPEGAPPARDPWRQKLERVLSLRRELEAMRDRPVPRVSSLSAADFYDNHYFANRPVVIEDFAADWPALERWHLEQLSERIGHKEVLVTRGRESTPDCDANFSKLTQETTLKEFIEEVLALNGTPSNDLYMIANNRNAEDPEILGALLEDVSPPADYLDMERARGSASWWLGPAGTLTPMHHDTSNIIFCQIIGKKRFTMVSPLYTQMLGKTKNGFYSEVRGELLEELEIPYEVIDLEPGNALFIPVGWWHEVLALEPSVNISFLNFKHSNQFNWYTPAR
ncbi:MAG: cupin-like domain-containing protein [Myxococcota bacterium]|nr:cupin-like domain-containing protein [Myxococcota bacterium]